MKIQRRTRREATKGRRRIQRNNKEEQPHINQGRSKYTRKDYEEPTEETRRQETKGRRNQREQKPKGEETKGEETRDKGEVVPSKNGGFHELLAQNFPRARYARGRSNNALNTTPKARIAYTGYGFKALYVHR